MTEPAPRDRNAEVDFRGERRSNATHASTTDPDARLFRKSRGTGAILCFKMQLPRSNKQDEFPAEQNTGC